MAKKRIVSKPSQGLPKPAAGGGNNWMAGAVKPANKGKFSAKAQAAGMSTHAFAEKKKHAGGTLGKEANLALTFEKTSKK